MTFFQKLSELKTTSDYPKLLLHKLSEEEILKYQSTREASLENCKELRTPRLHLKRRRSTLSSKGYSDETDYSYQADSSDETDASEDLIRPAKRAKRDIQAKTNPYAK
jgi:hypothetical protein